MMVVALLGGRKELLYKSLVNVLASSGYRVVAVTQLKKVSMIREMRELAEAGAGMVVAYSARRVMLSTTYVPETLDDMRKMVSCLAPVSPDILILLGFQNLVKKDESVLKALAVWSAKEAESLLEGISSPVVGVYSDRGDYKGGYPKLEDLAHAIIEEGMKRRLIPPRAKLA